MSVKDLVISDEHIPLEAVQRRSHISDLFNAYLLVRKLWLVTLDSVPQLLAIFLSWLLGRCRQLTAIEGCSNRCTPGTL